MQALQLREGETLTLDAPLTGEQLEILGEAHVGVRPVGMRGRPSETAWELRPSSHVGVFRCGDLNVVIRPRIPMDRVMFLVGFSLSPGDWGEAPFSLTIDDDILEAIVPAFVRLTQEAIRRGLLQGYRTEEAALSTIRGRIRVSEQVNRRYGWPMPVEVSHDDFTEDIEENRLLKTAIHLLGRMPVKSAEAIQGLNGLRPAFASVSLGTYRRGVVPEVHYTRLNRNYRPAVEMARLAIGSTLLEFLHGEAVGASLLVDMNRVFGTFVRTALRQELRLSESQWPAAPTPGRPLHLAEEGQVRVNPGLSWWRGSRCVFVGDTRYTSAEDAGDGGGHQSDIYRMLAYCTAADLPSGLLVYAGGQAESAVHRIRHSEKTIEVVSLDLSGTPGETLEQVQALAERVKAHREGMIGAV